ncbi:PepSY domain-containing protein OS=Castellaniella defragrans OX=75697 GN=HNR28_001165 PE=4 SV=1 [Castellaniella denitrificans]|uniref:PepSY domain-containing protein n=1 Tax=Castellaniella sp. TaxID=1955812 RepID=UPI002AFEB75E|nr:PepSY domain-containing protein [Castellaniella sp.]
MKKSWNALGACLLAASLGLAAAPAMAGDDCDVPIERWQTREAVTQMARQKGWDLQRVKIDDGCYEVRGKDAQGRAFKAKLDPETLAVVKIKYRDHDGRDRDRRRDRDRDHRDSRGAAPGAMPAAAPAAAAGKPSAAVSVSGARIE